MVVYATRIYQMERTLATLKRYTDQPNYAYSDTLKCDIVFDTGAKLNVITPGILELFQQSIFNVVPTITNVTLQFADGKTTHYRNGWNIILPLSMDCWINDQFFALSNQDDKKEFLVLGHKFLKQNVVKYTRETIQLLDSYPKEYSIKVPIISQNKNYYVKLSLNGHEYTYLLDTGYSYEITQPINDIQYAISPITSYEKTFYFNGVKQIVEFQEEKRGCIELCGITRHGPIEYSDFFMSKYLFNPARIFADFVIDLKRMFIGFNKV